MTEEIIARARVILGVEEEDELLAICAEEAAYYVLSYCHLDVMPEKLYAITARIAVEAYKKGSDDDIVSLKEGDREVTYAVFESVMAGFSKKLDPFVDCNGRVPSEVRHV